MLILELNVGEEKYGIEAIQVLEIIPLIELKKVPMTDKQIIGLLNYRGIPTPVIDLCRLFENRNSNKSLSTRIVIIEYKTLTGEPRPIGLVAERITDIIKCAIDELANSGIQKKPGDLLGLIYKYNNEMIQLIDTHNILPESIRNQLTDENT